ncbi:hypothetical protein EZV62_018884 [Acer yangbiense]|uniref:Uncharacterized protein n=1 Tax=Acer yangbiense TaxID=1000413 RepID=A0A5C7H9H0_9ROSI|nr:hypothetical protein EZV62_018884 [Acer yangbiense]
MPPPSSAKTSGASTVPHQYFTRFDIFRNINCSIRKTCTKYRKQTLAVLFVLLEMISIILDIFGTNTWDFSLASFVLSAFGVVMTLYDAFFIEKGIWSRLTAVEIVFSFTQMIVAYIDLVVKIIRIKINYNYKASAFPLGFAIIVLVYAFKSNEKSPPTELTSTDPVESSASRKWSDLPGKQTQAMVADSDLPVSSISINENPKSDGFDGVSKDNLVDKQDGLKKRKTMARLTKIVKEGAEDVRLQLEKIWAERYSSSQTSQELL